MIPQRTGCHVTADQTEKTFEGYLESDLGLPDVAVEWLVDVYRMIQSFDDVHDGDPTSDFTQAVWTSLAGMSMNAFYETHRAFLQPLMIASVLKWFAANLAEDAGEADERSYMWRAGFYDLVLMCVALCHGYSPEYARKALNLYGETFQEYIEEFRNA